MRMLIGAGADVHATNKGGDNALGVSVLLKEGHETVKALLDAGSKVTQPNSKGITALGAACSGACKEVVELVVDAAVKEGGEEALTAVDSGKRTPLFIASQAGNVAAVRLLVGRGSPGNVADNSGRDPLQIAESLGHKEVVAVLKGEEYVPEEEKSEELTEGTSNGTTMDSEVPLGIVEVQEDK